MKKTLILCLLSCAMAVHAQTARKFTLDLTADGKAQMVCFLPQQPSGRAIVGVPGGGYSMLSNTHEGYLASEWLNQQGIAYFVVNYRLPHGDRTLPMGDVEQGIRTVRDSAGVWGINPRDVGIMGFSAGGHLASVISTLSDYAVRPDFSILFYPVISMDERLTHKYSCINFLGEGQKDPELVKKYSTQNAVRRHLTPPALIITASDDRLVPPVTNALAYYSAMRNAGNECAMYIYPSGDHGFGFGTWFPYHDQLLSDLGNWLKSLRAPRTDALRVACVGNSITDGHGIDMADRYGYPALLQKSLGDGYWVKNFGVSGRTLLDKGDYPYMQEQAWKDALAFEPDIVVIKLGTNDSKPQNWQYASELKTDLKKMITSLRPDLAQPVKKKGKRAKKAAAPAKPRIVLCTPIPAFKSSWDINEQIIAGDIIPQLQEVAAEYGLEVIDLHEAFTGKADEVQSDGIHPNEKGVKHMADIIAEKVKQAKE